MDIYGYPTSWSEKDAKTPGLKLGVKAWTYALGQGEVPEILTQYPDAYEGDAFKLEAQENVNQNLTGDPRGSLDGHHCVTDINFMALLETDRETPVAPCFVRDLAGREIYLGGPLIKPVSEWSDYARIALDNEGNLTDGLVPFISFPRFARDASEMEGHDLLEHVLLTRFRMLDFSGRAKSVPSGADEEAESIAGSYMAPNLYPYKYRLDTFYIDGYKLPQTVMLFAKRGDQVNVPAANKLGEELVKAWDLRQPGQGYEDFIAAKGGEDWVEELYQKGCTLVPTFEAANGYHVVSETFELEDFWPGRSVSGLHEVVEQRADKAPAGTILEVLQPGYVTGNTIVPARVITSDGSGYVSPNDARDPDPYLPNMDLPHQRTLANWNATWLPTHPMHFEAPALWGYDIITGHFMQLNGPIWDPLHYYYDCMDGIIMAMKKPLEQDQNRWLVPVPQEFHNRFHPIVPMHGFDVHSVEAIIRRKEENRRPYSIVTRVRKSKESAGIGYHPLPIEFEYELDPFWFPTLHPLNREQGPVSEELFKRLAPIIRPKVEVSEYIEQVNGPEEMTWLRDENQMQRPSDNPLANYPHLMRFVVPDLPLDKVIPLIPVPFLADTGPEILEQGTEEYFAGMDRVEDVSAISPSVFDAWWDAREKGHKWIKFRHVLYQAAIELYALGWWYGASPLLLEEMLVDWMNSADVDVGTRQAGAADQMRR